MPAALQQDAPGAVEEEDPLGEKLFERCAIHGSRIGAAMSPTALSYAHGAVDVPLRGETIGGLWDAIVAAHGPRDALVSRARASAGRTPSSTSRSSAARAGCSRAGVAQGDRVGIWSPNNAEWVVVQFATAKIGAILVNINPAYRRTSSSTRCASPAARC